MDKSIDKFSFLKISRTKLVMSYFIGFCVWLIKGIIFIQMAYSRFSAAWEPFSELNTHLI